MVEAAQRATGLSPGRARALLGRFLFSGEDAEKPLDGLSGGERRRLSLAVLVQSGANVLILDEPTNHLDIESREALEDALRAFAGAILLVSHDRALLDAVGTRTVAVRGRVAAQLPGRLARVRARPRGAPCGRERQALAPMARPAAVRAEQRQRRGAAGRGQAGRRRAARAKGPSKNRLSDTGRPSGPSRRPRRRCASSKQELADPAAWATRYEAAKSEARHTAAKRAVEEAYARLEALID